MRLPFASVVLVSVALCGCDSGSVSDGERGGVGDASTAHDVTTPIDAIAEAPTDAPQPSDVAETPPPADVISADAPIDVAPADTAVCKTTCGGSECGPIPNGCGGTVDCGDCGSPGETCISYPTPLFQGAVHNAIAALVATNPT